MRRAKPARDGIETGPRVDVITEAMRTCPDGTVLTLNEYLHYVVARKARAQVFICGEIGGPNLNLSSRQAKEFREGLRPVIDQMVRELQEEQALAEASGMAILETGQD